jgi:hypothetical protein
MKDLPLILPPDLFYYNKHDQDLYQKQFLKTFRIKFEMYFHRNQQFGVKSVQAAGYLSRSQVAQLVKKFPAIYGIKK